MENSEFTISDYSPHNKPRTRTEKTTAITLRIPEEWHSYLQALAIKASYRRREKLNVQDLIRLAIEEQFIESSERQILRREMVMTEVEQFNICEKILKATGNR